MNIDLVHAFFAACWIAFIAFAGVFSYAFFRWVSYSFFPIRTITVNYYHNGKLRESTKIDLTSKESLVRQLRKKDIGSSHE